MDFMPVNRDILEEAMNKMAVVVFGERNCVSIASKSGRGKSSPTRAIAIASNIHPSPLSVSGGAP